MWCIFVLSVVCQMIVFCEIFKMHPKIRWNVYSTSNIKINAYCKVVLFCDEKWTIDSSCIFCNCNCGAWETFLSLNVLPLNNIQKLLVYTSIWNIRWNLKMSLLHVDRKLWCHSNYNDALVLVVCQMIVY